MNKTNPDIAHISRSVDAPAPPPLVRRWWHEIPMWLFYVPVGFALLAMMLRYRSVRAPLMANPGLEKGGLFPKSKQDFFDLFPGDSPLVPVSLRLEGGYDDVAVCAAYDRFTGRLGYAPKRFVVKPDEGIQGQDIHFLDSGEQLLTFWQSGTRGDGDWLLQEYIGGLEIALFYNQQDAGKPGRILSMTAKHGFEVTGDGRSTIEELIEEAKADRGTKRQVKKTNAHRLGDIPLPQMPVELIEVRNHHLGATFQDISDLVTRELEQGLCRHLDPLDGFQYGRLDCRVPNFDFLLQGRGIKALEVNALYSEPVHAYDPKYGLWDAYRIFVNHWHQAVKAGLANIRNKA